MDTHRSVRVWTRVQIAASLFLILGVMVLGYLAFQTHSALCAFKQDLQRRADNGRLVLEQNPGDPIHYLGLVIPRDQLEASVQNQERTLAALESVQWCERP